MIVAGAAAVVVVSEPTRDVIAGAAVVVVSEPTCAPLGRNLMERALRPLIVRPIAAGGRSPWWPLEPDWCRFPGPMPLGRSPLGGRSPLDWMDLIRWLLGDWCPLEPFAAAGPIAAGPEPVAAGARMMMPSLPETGLIERGLRLGTR